MTPDGLAALKLVSAFLAQDILPAVPRALTGELRAAIKLLDTARDELDALYPALLNECRELLALCGDAQPLLGDLSVDSTPLKSLARRVDQGFTDLSALMACHREVLELVSRTFLAIQGSDFDPLKNRADLDAMLQRFCTVLARHAQTRLPWQAVF